MNIKPLGDRVVIKVKEEKTKRGLSFQTRPRKTADGRGLAVGGNSDNGKVYLEVKTGIKFYLPNMPVQRLSSTAKSTWC